MHQPSIHISILGIYSLCIYSLCRRYVTIYSKFIVYIDYMQLLIIWNYTHAMKITDDMKASVLLIIEYIHCGFIMLSSFNIYNAHRLYAFHYVAQPYEFNNHEFIIYEFYWLTYSVHHHRLYNVYLYIMFVIIDDITFIKCLLLIIDYIPFINCILLII